MIGNIEQMVALVSHGNDFLRTGRMDPTFSPGYSVFLYCNRVDFRVVTKRRLFFKGKESVVAGDPNGWFKYLREGRFDTLHFKYTHSKEETMPDFALAGMVGGGGKWMIQAISGNEFVLWNEYWDAQPDRQDEEIWAVTYFTDGKRHEYKPVRYDVVANLSRLESALIEISEFARSKALDWWAEIFDKALVRSRESLGENNHNENDLIVGTNYSAEQKRLMAVAAAAWVFGGMGSWNDIAFESEEDQNQYMLVSNGLYDAINFSLEAVLNQ